MPEFGSFDPQGKGFAQTLDVMGATQSMMQRAEAAKRAQADFEYEQGIRALRAPIEEAQRNADMVKAMASLDDAKRMQEQIARARSQKSIADQEFDDLQFIEDPDERENAMINWSAKYAPLKNIAEHSSDISNKLNLIGDSIKDIRTTKAARASREAQFNVEEMKKQYDLEKANAAAEAKAALDAEKAARVEEANQLRRDLQQQRLESAGNQAYQRSRGEGIAKQMTDLQSRVVSHYDTLAQTQRARSLLDSDAEQGRGRATILGVEQAINTVIPGLFDTSKEEALKTTYADMALQAATKMRGQGQITENERRLLADTVAQYGNSPQGARYVMDFMDAIAQREIARAEAMREIERKNKFVDEGDLNGYLRDHPISEFLKTNVPTGKPSTGSVVPVIKSVRLVNP
jgi:hypothetical protein